MATYSQRRLKWDRERQCFRKFYKGHLYRFGKGLATGPEDSSYELAEMKALEEWATIKSEIDRGERQEQRVKSETRPAPVAPAPKLDIRLPVKQLENTQAFASPYNQLRFARQGAIARNVEDTTVEQLIDAYLSHRADEARAGTVTPRTYSQDRQRLFDFRDFCTVEQAIMASQIDAPLLDHYRACQLRLITRQDEYAISGETAKGRLSVTSRMLRWAYQREHIAELPRNLDSTYTRVKIEWPEVTPWTVEEVRAIFGASSQRLRCYIALALNGGFTQMDIATLEHKHIDWKAGLIDRRRNKTRTPQCVKLWPITQELVKAEMTKGSGLVFLTELGKPVVHERVREDGGVTTTDSVRQMLNRALQRMVREQLEASNPDVWDCLPETAPSSADNAAKLAAIEQRKRERNRLLGRERRKDPRGFKTFRKCGADAIAEQFQDAPHLTDQYLAHGNKGMRDRYARHHFRLLHDATDWLCQHFDLAGVK